MIFLFHAFSLLSDSEDDVEGLFDTPAPKVDSTPTKKDEVYYLEFVIVVRDDKAWFRFYHQFIHQGWYLDVKRSDNIRVECFTTLVKVALSFPVRCAYFVVCSGFPASTNYST